MVSLIYCAAWEKEKMVPPSSVLSPKADWRITDIQPTQVDTFTLPNNAGSAALPPNKLRTSP